jgi:tetratricopeptide (TPR) repeat protein
MSDKLEHIDDFFKGELNADQIKSFEKRVTEDPDFADELAFYLSSVHTLRQDISRNKKEHFKSLLFNNRKSESTNTRLWPYLSAAAATVLILIGVYIFYPNSSPDDIAQSYIDKNLSTLSVMMNSTEDSAQRGVRLYNENKFAEALQTFESILKNNPTVMEYAGIVSLRLENYDNALRHFERLSKATQLYANSGNFYKSLTLMKRNRPGDVQQAKALLTRIVDEQSANEQAARELLKRF